MRNHRSESGQHGGRLGRSMVVLHPLDFITMHAFQLSGIDPAPFQPLFDLDDEALAEIGAVRRTADTSPGFPCRVSLDDAAVGDELLLLPYVHHAVASPYRAAGPIFVRRGAVQRTLAVNEVPAYVSRRLISLRGYDRQQMMVAAEVCEGPLVADALHRFFGDANVAYIHLHNARQGCFSCLVNRA